MLLSSTSVKCVRSTEAGLWRLVLGLPGVWALRTGQERVSELEVDLMLLAEREQCGW